MPEPHVHDKFVVHSLSQAQNILADIDHLESTGRWKGDKTPDWALEIIERNFEGAPINPMFARTCLVATRAVADFLFLALKGMENARNL